jgi:hypothetical protein
MNKLLKARVQRCISTLGASRNELIEVLKVILEELNDD